MDENISSWTLLSVVESMKTSAQDSWHSKPDVTLIYKEGGVFVGNMLKEWTYCCSFCELEYARMDEATEEEDDCLSEAEARERQLFAKKKSRSKSLPINSLLDPRRQTLLKLKLQKQQQQQQQQQQGADDQQERVL